MLHIQFELERLYDLVREKEQERDDLKIELLGVKNTMIDMNNEKELLKDEIKYLKEKLNITNQIMEDIKGINRIYYNGYKDSKNKIYELQQKINSLTDCTIRYKRSVDPDDLENYIYEGRTYLRDILTDAVYSKKGKLIGYIHEETGLLVKI